MAGGMRFSTKRAYMWWLIGFFGCLGFHRFYMGKSATGFLWLCTGGLLGFGAIYDLCTLPFQVRGHNVRHG
jgi:TM2 domain-containing membrane protein YozV